MKMPLLFVGHGSPMNAIQDNTFTQTWKQLGRSIPVPRGILSISAHWYTGGTRTSDEENPEIIYDMFGFPGELYQKKYPAPGAPAIAGKLKGYLKGEVDMDRSWGIDHGTWSVLCHMFPEADIPVVQLSIDQHLPPEKHYDLGRRIRSLRDEGVLILGSGNIVHNLALINWEMAGGYPWAYEFDQYIENSITARRPDQVIQYHKAGESHKNAFWTPEHFLPLLYILAAADEKDPIQVFNKDSLMGSISMTGYLFGNND